MISSATSQNDYAGSSSTSIYAFSFYVITPAQLLVTTEVGGIITTLVLNTDYTVAQNTDITTGGNINLLAGNLPTGTSLVIMRNVPLTQLFSFPNNGQFFPHNYELALDQLCMEIQNLQAQLNNCIRYPFTETQATSVLPTAPNRANLDLGFDASGNAIVEA